MLLRACEVEAPCGREPRSRNPERSEGAQVSVVIVAVDTSGKQGSIALCRGDGESFEVLQLTSLEGGTYSAQLMPRIAEALRRNNLDKRKVDGFVIVSGPGSFTGLRVGLATVKGLCEVLRKPLATVSKLEAIALTYGRAGQAATVALDAGRGEVYVGEYEVSAGRTNVVREYIAKLDAFATEAASISGDFLTPDGKVAEAVQARNLRARLVPAIHADEVGRIGLRKLLVGDTADPATVDVNYIRRSDAELFSTPKH
jgi:tRNA threonylcarbamoyladenosine biosynthesis protein TsaB